MFALTITVVIVSMLLLAALELWLFWRLGERERGRRSAGSERPVRDPADERP